MKKHLSSIVPSAVFQLYEGYGGLSKGEEQPSAAQTPVTTFHTTMHAAAVSEGTATKLQRRTQSSNFINVHDAADTVALRAKVRERSLFTIVHVCSLLLLAHEL